MNLNDEQFEEAMRERLRRALSATHAPAGLAARVRQGIAAAPAKAARPLYLRFIPAVAAAAAAVLVVAIPLALYFGSPDQAQAAQAELAQIHQLNMSGHGNFYSEDDPAKLAAYFKKELGFTPAMPKPGQGLAMRSCCVAHFGKGVAGSYVVKTAGSGLISIIVVRETPKDLGLTDAVGRDGKTYYRGAYARNNLATVRLGDYTYCAVANNDVNPDKLIDLLGRLVN